MESHYVLTGRWFKEPVNVREAVESEYETIDVPSGAIHPDDSGASDGVHDIAFVEENFGGIVILHTSSGELESTNKVKGYVHTLQTVWMDDEEIREWEEECAEKLDEWLTEKTGVGYPDPVEY